MSVNAVEFLNVTKDYGSGRGIFDLSFTIEKGKTFGYLGTNGAGKTTTFRHIMGFIKPDSGVVKVSGLDPWVNGETIKNSVGYIPGEIGFPAAKNCKEFLKFWAEIKGVKDFKRMNYIIDVLGLDTSINLKKMSKGTRQKAAIVAALTSSPEILVLDEPTTGLDPNMRKAFLSLIKEEKERGATILISSHIFDELDKTCDEVGLIKDGRLVDFVNVERLKNAQFSVYLLEFPNLELAKAFDFKAESKQFLGGNKNILRVKFNKDYTSEFIRCVANSAIISMNEETFSVGNYFLEKLKGGE